MAHGVFTVGSTAYDTVRAGISYKFAGPVVAKYWDRYSPNSKAAASPRGFFCASENVTDVRCGSKAENL
jgi:hypothetical protein